MSRPRSASLAALAVAVTAPLGVVLAAPAYGAGGDAVVDAVVTDGNVRVQSTKGLSRVTVVLCDGVTVVKDNWGGDQKTGDVKVDGVVQAVFIHSGNNTTPEAQRLLAALAGASAVKGNSTGAIGFHDDDACDEPEATTTTTSSSTTTTTTVTVVIPGSSTTTTTTIGGGSTTTTSTPTGDTTTTTGQPESATTTTASDDLVAGVTTSTEPLEKTIVLGETLTRPDEPAAAASPGAMARTGAGRVMFLVTLGLALVGIGVALVSAFRRRRPLSASSPG